MFERCNLPCFWGHLCFCLFVATFFSSAPCELWWGLWHFPALHCSWPLLAMSPVALSNENGSLFPWVFFSCSCSYKAVMGILGFYVVVLGNLRRDGQRPRKRCEGQWQRWQDDIGSTSSRIFGKSKACKSLGGCLMDASHAIESYCE